MKSKNWLWILAACLAIVAVYQVVKLTGGDSGSAESPSPEIEPAFPRNLQATHTASLAELPGMLEMKRPPVKEPAKIEEPQETIAATAESSAPSPKEEQQDPAEIVEEPEARDHPPAVGDQPAKDPTEARAVVAPVVKPSNRGLVRSIVYSKDRGSAFIGEKIVKTGATIDGVKVVNIDAGGVEFERNGRRWTQKVGETPDPQWQ